MERVRELQIVVSDSVNLNYFIDIEKVRDLLPSGSGFDCKWHIERLKNGKILIKSEYHAMDSDSGMYAGYFEFWFTLYVEIPKLRVLTGRDPGNLQLYPALGAIGFSDIHGDERACSAFFGLREYIGEMIAECISSKYPNIFEQGIARLARDIRESPDLYRIRHIKIETIQEPENQESQDTEPEPGSPEFLEQKSREIQELEDNGQI